MRLPYIIRVIRGRGIYAQKSKDSGDQRDLQVIKKDILNLYQKHKIRPNEYVKYSIGLKTGAEREEIISHLCNKKQWLKWYYENWKFLAKYSCMEWESSLVKRTKRKKAYIERYHMGKHCDIQYGVTFIAEHYHTGKIAIGDYCIFARNSDVDCTGDLTIEDGVKISEGTKILTHNHNLDFSQRDELSYGLIKTPLVIQDNVGIGAHAIIMPGVSEIGRRAMIASGAVVKRQVPPYAIVMGNPARVVGFRYPPAVIAEFEEESYPEKERIPIEVLEENYNKYYLSKLTEIKSFLG